MKITKEVDIFDNIQMAEMLGPQAYSVYVKLNQEQLEFLEPFLYEASEDGYSMDEFSFNDFFRFEAEEILTDNDMWATKTDEEKRIEEIYVKLAENGIQKFVVGKTDDGNNDDLVVLYTNIEGFDFDLTKPMPYWNVMADYLVKQNLFSLNDVIVENGIDYLNNSNAEDFIASLRGKLEFLEKMFTQESDEQKSESKSKPHKQR